MRKIKAPGDCVSVDQLESRTPGFIGVMREVVIKRRYTCSTIFINHVSDLSYIHMQKSLTVGRIQSLPNEHSKRSLETMVLLSNIIILIMAGLLIKTFWQHLKKTIKVSVSVLPMLNIKMAR